MLQWLSIYLKGVDVPKVLSFHVNAPPPLFSSRWPGDSHFVQDVKKWSNYDSGMWQRGCALFVEGRRNLTWYWSMNEVTRDSLNSELTEITTVLRLQLVIMRCQVLYIETTMNILRPIQSFIWSWNMRYVVISSDFHFDYCWEIIRAWRELLKILREIKCWNWKWFKTCFRFKSNWLEIGVSFVQ